MTDWTPPQYVTAGDASSSQYNAEAVDNLEHLFERTRGAIAFAGTTSVPTGLGLDTTIQVVEVLANADLDYSVAGGVVTLHDAGIWLVTMGAIFGAGGTGTIRWARANTTGSGEVVRDAAPPSATLGPGVSGATAFAMPAGEGIRIAARHDQGANVSVTGRLALILLAPT